MGWSSGRVDEVEQAGHGLTIGFCHPGVEG